MNQNIGVTVNENRQILDKINEIDLLILDEKLRKNNLNEEADFYVKNLDKEYSNEFKDLNEKLDYYKDTYQIDIEVSKGLNHFVLEKSKLY